MFGDGDPPIYDNWVYDEFTLRNEAKLVVEPIDLSDEVFLINSTNDRFHRNEKRMIL